MIARRVFYTGRVQGVGFRYSTKQIASGFDVCGWVKNLPDRRVELHGQGDATEVDAFLADILQSNLGSFIRDHEVVSATVEPGLRSFSIVRA